ncbi:MAG: hypothetical protein EOM52_03605 [Clostridia bacterium]|nr:hypothetical protein [Clostridia bacterium]
MSYCEHCEKEYPGLTCPVCGGPLLQEVTPEDLEAAHPEWGREAGRLLDEWPKGPGGEPEEPGMLALAQDFEYARGLILARLEADGIPAFCRYPEGGGAGKVILGFSGYGVYLYVPKSRLEEARELVGGLTAPGRKS